MILGSKPLSEMNEAEMLAALNELRDAREALRAEAIKKKVDKEQAAVAGPTPKEPKARTPKVKEKGPMDDIIQALIHGDDK